MKGKNSSTLLILLLFLAIPFNLLADLTYTSNGSSITITGSNPQATGDIIIPATIDNLPVTTIGQGAFASCANLNSVTIPETVRTIDFYGFAYCPNLTSVKFKGDSPTLGGSVFFSSPNVTVYYVLGKADWASTFADRPTAQWFPPPTITSSAVATTIVGLPFSYTISATHAPTSFAATDLPQGLVLDSLTGLISGIPTTLGSHMVTISANNSGGAGNQLLALIVTPPPPKITSPATAGAIQGQPFTYNITADNSPTLFKAEGLPAGLGINPRTGVISGYPWNTGNHTVSLFASNSGGTGNQVVVISVNGLHYVRHGTTITIAGGNPLTGNLTIPATLDGLPVTAIAPRAFQQSGFSSLTIPDSVTSVGDNAFNQCQSLTSITIGKRVTSIGDAAFYLCSQASINLPDSITHIGNNAFYGCVFADNNLPNSLSYIGDYAFGVSRGLTNVTIPDSVTYLGDNSFSDSKSLANVIIPDNVTYVGKEAFTRCSVLTNVTIGQRVTHIGANAFAGCSSLTSIIIPDGVTYIGAGAFANSGLVTTTIGNRVPYIPSQAFFNCSSLRSVTFGTEVTAIGENSFFGCSSLTGITIPDRVFYIGAGAFSYSGLTSMTIPDSVNYIGTSAFAYSRLTSTYIGNSVTHIPDSTFSYCSLLRSVTVGTGVTFLGDSAFGNCSSLSSVYFKGDAPSSHNYWGVFSWCPSFQIYYVLGKTGWGSDFAGRPTAPFVPAKRPFITSPAIATARVGLQFNHVVIAENLPTEFTAYGLPTGLALDPITGVISGTPTTQGTHSVILHASNTGGTHQQNLTLTIGLPSALEMRISYETSRSQINVTVMDGGTLDYTVEYTDDFKHWIPLAAKLVGTKDLSTLDPEAATRPFRFYRVIQQ